MQSPPLAHEDHLDVLTCVHALHACRSLAEFPQRALDAIGTLVPNDLAAFNEVNVRRKRIVAVMSKTVGDHDQLAERWQRVMDQHPMVRHATETGDGQALKFSDFFSSAEYHRLPLYRDFYRALGAEDQFSITVHSDDGVLIAVALNRPRRDFTESERVKLNLVRPHFVQAYANVKELEDHAEEKRDLHTALRETGHGVIGFDAGRGVTHATPGAHDCLARYFPVGEPMHRLPSPIVDWLDADADVAFTADAAHSQLIVRRPRGADRTVLLLSEVNDTRPRGARPLTPREREVCGWLADGKSNTEIAAILGIAPGTVKQHVEHILAKLGVPNRTAAAAYARERGLNLAGR